MTCPVCGNDYRSQVDFTDFEMDGDTVIAIQNWSCGNCESEFVVREVYKYESESEPEIIREGDKSNFEPWLH